MAAPSNALKSDEIYTQLRSQILSGELPPGHWVVESELSRQLGVSQAPVREAVRRLAQEGLLTHQPRRGNFVASISDQEQREARVVRQRIEALAAELAATAASPAEVDRLFFHVEQMREAVAANDMVRFRENDVLFHRTMVEISGNTVLLRTWAVLEPILISRRSLSDPFWNGGDWDMIVESHDRMARLIRDHEVEEAGREAERHARGARDLQAAGRTTQP